MIPSDLSDSPAAAAASALVIPFPVRAKRAGSRPQRLPRRAAGAVTVQNSRVIAPDWCSPAAADVRVAAADPSPEQRLNRALSSLNVALAEQRSAVAAWRDGLVTLRTTTARLSESLQRYRVNLDKLNDSVSKLGDNARSLETLADGVAATGD
ncbi:hypothetical protein [Rhodopila sp.]|uniref:hypothetical protein n=1 Tax=Rhodopila sp. TaxID=2480087 RepID=UPI003D0E21CA